MPQPQFIPSPLKIIERRRCQNCGATMMMTGIEPMGLGTGMRRVCFCWRGFAGSILSSSELLSRIKHQITVRIP